MRGTQPGNDARNSSPPGRTSSGGGRRRGPGRPPPPRQDEGARGPPASAPPRSRRLAARVLGQRYEKRAGCEGRGSTPGARPPGSSAPAVRPRGAAVTVCGAEFSWCLSSGCDNGVLPRERSPSPQRAGATALRPLSPRPPRAPAQPHGSSGPAAAPARPRRRLRLQLPEGSAAAPRHRPRRAGRDL